MFPNLWLTAYRVWVPMQTAFAASMKKSAGHTFPFPLLTQMVQRCSENQLPFLRAKQTQQMCLALYPAMCHIIKSSNTVLEKTTALCFVFFQQILCITNIL